MPRPTPVTFGLYGWTPDYGYHYLHPANRRSFEVLEPLGKLFENLGEDETGEWLTLRYDEQQFRVSPELFKELPGRPAFSFGDEVEEAQAPAGRYRHFGRISDVYWDEVSGTATYQLVERKRKVPIVFREEELRLG